jgi:hypothetical protein
VRRGSAGGLLPGSCRPRRISNPARRQLVTVDARLRTRPRGRAAGAAPPSVVTRHGWVACRERPAQPRWSNCTRPGLLRGCGNGNSPTRPPSWKCSARPSPGRPGSLSRRPGRTGGTVVRGRARPERPEPAPRPRARHRERRSGDALRRARRGGGLGAAATPFTQTSVFRRQAASVGSRRSPPAAPGCVLVVCRKRPDAP